MKKKEFPQVTATIVTTKFFAAGMTSKKYISKHLYLLSFSLPCENHFIMGRCTTFPCISRWTLCGCSFYLLQRKSHFRPQGGAPKYRQFHLGRQSKTVQKYDWIETLLQLHLPYLYNLTSYVMHFERFFKDTTSFWFWKAIVPDYNAWKCNQNQTASSKLFDSVSSRGSFSASILVRPKEARSFLFRPVFSP